MSLVWQLLLLMANSGLSTNKRRDSSDGRDSAYQKEGPKFKFRLGKIFSFSILMMNTRQDLNNHADTQLSDILSFMSNLSPY